MLQPGDKAPDFTLPDQNGDPVKLSNLTQGPDRRTVFYPRADTAINSVGLRSAQP